MNTKLKGLVLHKGNTEIGIRQSLYYNDLSKEEIDLFLECVLDLQKSADEMYQLLDWVMMASLEADVMPCPQLSNNVKDTLEMIKEKQL